MRMKLLHIIVSWTLLCVGTVVWASYFVNDTALQRKVWQSTQRFDGQNVPVSQRSLVIYRLGELSSGESLDVIENNVKIFSAAVQSHSASASHQAFYVFRVVGGKRNKLARHLPPNLANVALSKCAANEHHDLAAHVHAIQMFGATLVSRFHSILFLSHQARGPFEGRENGAWLHRITNVFNSFPNVGILGSSISCEITPHVQSHALAMRAEAAVKILLESRIKGGLLETGLTTTALKLGYNISSLTYQRRWNETVFSGECRQAKGNYPMYDLNPSSWCDIRPEDALFMKWGGAPLSLRGYYCQHTIDSIQEATLKIAKADQSVHLALPETIFGGPLYALSKEYDLERWNDHFVQHLQFNSLPRGGQEPQKVCFLVRSAVMHGRNAAANNANEVRMDLDLFISSLMRQTNMNWEAYFFVTDDQPFDEELQEILRSHNDIRLKFLDINKQFRPKYNPIDAAYPASDEAMRIVMQKPECKWLSVTNGDNAYGSEVVEYVLGTKAARSNLVLLPMDSRNFANADCRLLRARLKNEGYEGYCRYFEKRHQKQMYGFARQPIPRIGGVDIASVFIDRDKFTKSNIFFNEFSSEKKPSTCLGCQDGAWVYAMVRKHKWSTHIPPFSGLKHMVFHGPSPLWCIASGNVWFEHPDHVACVSHAAVGRLNSTWFDLSRFHSSNSSRTCLRLSGEGFKHKDQKETILA